jgi:hypothetical protein
MRKNIMAFLLSYFDRNKKDITDIDKDKLLENIIFLPRQFHTENISSFNILKQNGYFKFNSKISNVDILNAVNRQPEVVKDWLAWSEDKRTGKGWVFEKVDEKYSVYYYPYKKKQAAFTFSNGNEAVCDFYQKRN